MTIQLLTFPGCPNAGAARDALREAMRRAKVSQPVEEIDISSDAAPSWATAWGSPTILVDGVDVAGRPPTPGNVSCRLYDDGGPSVDQIEDRLASSRSSSGRKPWGLPVVGSLAAALAASACCLLPAVLAIAGVSGAGLASSLAPWRPYFLVATGLMLVLAFWLSYRRQPVDCACPTPRSRRWSRIGLWISALIIVAAAVYPVIFAANASIGERVPGAVETRMRIAGMDCGSCTKVIAKSLSRVKGVATVNVDYDHGTASVTHDGSRDLSKELVEAVELVGYEASIVP